MSEPEWDDLDAYLAEALEDPAFARAWAEAAARARNGWPRPLRIDGHEYRRRQRSRRKRGR